MNNDPEKWSNQTWTIPFIIMEMTRLTRKDTEWYIEWSPGILMPIPENIALELLRAIQHVYDKEHSLEKERRTGKIV